MSDLLVDLLLQDALVVLDLCLVLLLSVTSDGTDDVLDGAGGAICWSRGQRRQDVS